jgi:hypothetical protein
VRVVSAILIGAACIAAGASVARAQAASEVDRWSDGPVALEVHLATGLVPTGIAGVALGFAPVRWLSLDAGGGVGGYGGAQVGLGLRPRLAFDAIALGLDVSWSVGPYDYDRCGWFHIDCEETELGEWDSAHWLGVGGSFEYRSLGGFLLRVYAGGGPLLNVSDGRCEDDEGSFPCSDRGRTFLGLVLGHAFGFKGRRPDGG